MGYCGRSVLQKTMRYWLGNLVANGCEFSRTRVYRCARQLKTRTITQTGINWSLDQRVGCNEKNQYDAPSIERAVPLPLSPLLTPQCRLCPLTPDFESCLACCA